RLGDFLGHFHVDRGIPDDLALLLGGRDHLGSGFLGAGERRRGERGEPRETASLSQCMHVGLLSFCGYCTRPRQRSAKKRTRTFDPAGTSNAAGAATSSSCPTGVPSGAGLESSTM